MVPQYLVFMKNGGQRHESPSFYYQKLQTELTNLGSNKSYHSLKIVCGFLIFAQKMLTSAKLWKPGKQLVYFFFLFLEYPYPEIWDTAKNDPQAYTDTEEPGSNRVKA